MRIEVTANAMDSSGFEESSTLGISDSNAAKIFRVLTESLYSSGAAAMARELISNAIDESPYATRPFVVSIPTRLNPVFCLRDYGRGMSHAFMMHRAFSLGDSTKDGRGLSDAGRNDDSDSTIGGFGLGLKTPFILCDQFTITVYRGYTAQTYVIDKPDGLPRVQTSDSMIRQLTEYETGTEITVTLPESRASELQKGIARVLQYLNPALYSVNGSIDFKPQQWAHESDSYSITKESQPSFVLLGPIAYPIDGAALGHDSWSDWPGKYRVAIKLAAGAAEVTGSREAIKWTPRSVAIVRDAMALAIDDIRIRMNDALANAPTLYDAIQMHAKLKDVAAIIGQQNAPHWRGVDMAKSIVLHCAAHWSRDNFYKERRRKIVTAFALNGTRHQGRSHVFLIDDPACKRNTISRRIERAFMINPQAEYVSVIPANDWGFAFVGAPVESIMNYEPVALETSRATRTKESKCYRLATQGHYLVPYTDQGGIFVPMNRASVCPVWLAANPGWSRLFNSAWFQEKNQRVYGLNQSQAKDADSNTWRDAFEWARECMHAELGIVRDWLAYRNVTNSPLYALAMESGFKSGNKRCDAILDAMREATPTTPRVPRLESQIVELIGMGLIEAVPLALPDLESDIESLFKKYPCAEYIVNTAYGAKRLELLPRAFG